MTTSLTRLVSRRLWFSGVTVAIAAAVVSALWLSSSSEPATATDRTVTVSGVRLDQKPPEARAEAKADREAFRAAMKAARKLKGQARADALEKVVADARAGSYGDKIEKRFDRKADRRAAVLAMLPDELRADLAKLSATAPGADRRAFRDEIRQKALDGEYGDKAQGAAEKLPEHWED